MMRILHVIPSLGKGGAERLVLDICHELQKAGNQVEIVVFRPLNHFTELSKGLSIHVIPSEVRYSITSPDKINTERFDAFVDEFRPQIIHSHLLESEFITRNRPIETCTYITHWHGCHPPTNERKLLDYLKKDSWWYLYSVYRLKRQYKRSKNHFLCISNFIQDYVKRAFNPSEDHLHLLLNATDLSKFEPQCKENDTSIFRLVAIGSFHPYKNQIFLLHAMKMLFELGETNVELIILGDGLERPKLEKYVSDNDLGRSVIFKGYVDTPEEFIQQSDALVHAAIDEPFGLILVEAMNMGLPVVAFRSGGIPEIVHDQNHGLLSETGDLEAFVHNIIQLKTDRSFRERLSQAARIRAQEFDIRRYVENLKSLYSRLSRNGK